MDEVVAWAGSPLPPPWSPTPLDSFAAVGSSSTGTAVGRNGKVVIRESYLGVALSEG